MDNFISETAESLWSKTLDSLVKELSPHVYDRWLKPIQPLRLSEGELALGVPDEFFKSWILDHYGSLLLLALRETTGRPDFKMSFEISNVEPVQPHPPRNADGSVPLKRAEARGVSPRAEASSRCRRY